MSEKFGDELRDLSLVADSLVGLENVSMLAARLAALAKRADDLEAENDRLVRKDINGQFVVGQIESELALLRRGDDMGEKPIEPTMVMVEKKYLEWVGKQVAENAELKGAVKQYEQVRFAAAVLDHWFGPDGEASSVPPRALVLPLRAALELIKEQEA